jgi:hypothetical protein
MKRLIVPVALAAALLAGTPMARSATHRHSMAEYAYLVGHWHCVARLPDGRAIARSVFNGVTPTHYFIRNYVTKSFSDTGKFVESDDRTKAAA